MARAKHPPGAGARTGARARSGPPSPESRLASKVFSVRLPPDVRAALDALVAREGKSRSATIARLITEASKGPRPPT
jgi:predicted HicB family RNase H-like nuclease